MSTYKRFNRHEVFNADDRSLVLDIIKKVEPFGKEANCLFGLFDGYYYDELMWSIYIFGIEVGLPDDMTYNLAKLLNKVQLHIDKNASK